MQRAQMQRSQMQRAKKNEPGMSWGRPSSQYFLSAYFVGAIGFEPTTPTVSR